MTDVWFLGVFPNKHTDIDLVLETVHLPSHGQYESKTTPCCLLIAMDELGIRFIFDSQDCKSANRQNLWNIHVSSAEIWALKSMWIWNLPVSQNGLIPVHLIPVFHNECCLFENKAGIQYKLYQTLLVQQTSTNTFSMFLIVEKTYFIHLCTILYYNMLLSSKNPTVSIISNSRILPCQKQHLCLIWVVKKLAQPMEYGPLE